MKFKVVCKNGKTTIKIKSFKKFRHAKKLAKNLTKRKVKLDLLYKKMGINDMLKEKWDFCVY